MKALTLTVVLLGLVAGVSLAQAPVPADLTADFSGSPVAASATFKASVLTFARVTIVPPADLSIQGTAGTEVKQDPADANDQADIADAAGTGGLIEWEFNDSILTDIEVTQFNSEQGATYPPTLPLPPGETPPPGEKLWTEYKLGAWWETYSKSVPPWFEMDDEVMGWAQIKDGGLDNQYGGQVIATLGDLTGGAGFDSADARYGRIWWGVGAKNLTKDDEDNYTVPAEKGDYYAVMVVTVHQ